MSASEAAALDEFPSPLESEVASALLLLSCTTTTTATPPPMLTLYSPPLKSNDMKKKRKKLVKKSSKRLSLSGSSSSSTVTTENEKHLNVMAMVSKFHKTITLKVVRKKRSKSLYISGTKKSSSGITEAKSEDSTVAASCVSNCSTDVNSTAGSRRREVSDSAGRTKDPERKTVIGSGHLGRLAEAIMKLLSSHSSASEVKIRQLLGDSPSTSKALRILLKMEKVKRSGGGGRSDPYVYTIA